MTVKLRAPGSERLKRFWINQPSTSQPFHDLHGQSVLANPESFDGDYCDAFFAEGPVIVQRIQKIALTPGSRVPRDCSRAGQDEETCYKVKAEAIASAATIRALEDRLTSIESLARLALAANPRDLEETWMRVEQLARTKGG